MTWDLIDLFNAVAAGDEATVVAALADGFNVDEPMRWTGETLLMHACATGQLAIARRLLEHGADPHVQHIDGYNIYDSSRTRALRELLLAHGYVGTPSWTVVGGPGWLAEFRQLAPRPMDLTWSGELRGRRFDVEVLVESVPRPQGTASVHLHADGLPTWTVVLRDTRHVQFGLDKVERRRPPLEDPDDAEFEQVTFGDGTERVFHLEVRLDGFVGDVRVRAIDVPTYEQIVAPVYAWRFVDDTAAEA